MNLLRTIHNIAALFCHLGVAGGSTCYQLDGPGSSSRAKCVSVASGRPWCLVHRAETLEDAVNLLPCAGNVQFCACF